MSILIKSFLILLFSVCANAQKLVPVVSNQTGTIQSFGQVTCPVGWLPADGTAVSRTLYKNLFDALGTTYGVGNGTTTFNLPNNRCTSDINCAMVFSAKVNTVPTITQENVDWLNNCTGTNTKTCNIHAGVFTVVPNCVATTVDSGDSQLTNLGTITISAYVTYGAIPNVIVQNFPHQITCTKTGADYKANPIRNACIKI